MASPYSSTTVSSYNSNPPSDDGSQTAANRVKWSTIKTKLSDPLNTFAAAVNSAISTAFGKIIGGAGTVSSAISYTVLSADQGKTVIATVAGITITTPDATSVGAPFVFGFLNNTSGNITLDGNGSQTIDGQTTVTVPAGAGGMLTTDGTNWFTQGQNWRANLPRGYIDGCILSNGTDAINDINISAGVCRDSTNTVTITVAAMSGKQLDANWAPGASAGMRNSAAGITDTTYHIYAVAKADETQDIYAHTSATAATVLTALQAESGGSAYAYARHIGSIIRASSTILAFVQSETDPDYFGLSIPVQDFSATPVSTSAVTRALASVPSGIKVYADIVGAINGVTTGGGMTALFTSLDSTDTAPSTSLFDVVSPAGTTNRAGNRKFVLTNTSTQIRTRLSHNGVSDSISAMVFGWRHPRGRT
jgi:hypothetical protein